jgi:hypothetical protein
VHHKWCFWAGSGIALELNADQVPKAIATRMISSTVAYIVEPEGVIVGEDEGEGPLFVANADWQ